MQHIKIIFGTNNLPLSLAIRWFTHSQWSHVGVVLDDRGDGQVLESTFRDGVRLSTCAKFVERYPNHSVAYLPTPNAANAKRRLRDQLGKPYDLTAIVALALRRDWQRQQRWFCSELVGFASGLYRQDAVRRVTPEDIWKLTKDSVPPNL